MVQINAWVLYRRAASADVGEGRNVGRLLGRETLQRPSVARFFFRLRRFQSPIVLKLVGHRPGGSIAISLGMGQVVALAGDDAALLADTVIERFGHRLLGTFGFARAGEQVSQRFFLAVQIDLNGLDALVHGIQILLQRALVGSLGGICRQHLCVVSGFLIGFALGLRLGLGRFLRAGALLWREFAFDVPYGDAVIVDYVVAVFNRFGIQAVGVVRLALRIAPAISIVRCIGLLGECRQAGDHADNEQQTEQVNGSSQHTSPRACLEYSQRADELKSVGAWL